MTLLRRGIRAISAAALMLFSADVAAQTDRDYEYFQRALAGCDASYQQAFNRVCGAPIRANNPGIYRKCLDEIAGHRDRCKANAQRKYENQVERRKRYDN